MKIYQSIVESECLGKTHRLISSNELSFTTPLEIHRETFSRKYAVPKEIKGFLSPWLGMIETMFFPIRSALVSK